jgi:8-oxo-dGTP pyrophosphatase MutT (NUDIX family)
MIRRAVAADDPWSGHMALPGGRRSPDDRDGMETAMREAWEEVGLDLRDGGSRLGRLDDVQPGSGAPRIVVSPYVFAVPAGAATEPNHEVALAIWVPLRRLAEPGAATHYLHALASGESLRFPAIGYQEHVIWGLTYRILSQFLEIARAAGAGGST